MVPTAEDDSIQLGEVSRTTREWHVQSHGATLARLYLSPAAGTQAPTCRLHFDGDVRSEVMRQVFDKVKREVLDRLRPGLCLVHRGHVVSSFTYGRGDGEAP